VSGTSVAISGKSNSLSGQGFSLSSGPRKVGLISSLPAWLATCREALDSVRLKEQQSSSEDFLNERRITHSNLPTAGFLALTLILACIPRKFEIRSQHLYKRLYNTPKAGVLHTNHRDS
jgi:hypothetical protein